METIGNLLTTYYSDEADVFLGSRRTDKGELNRNSLVTAKLQKCTSSFALSSPLLLFLRIFEYSDDILILTTNRIKSFDIAVQSRVHLAVRYQGLSLDQRKELFGKFIRQHPDEIENMNAIEEWIKDEFEDEVDGRQIRRIFSS